MIRNFLFSSMTAFGLLALAACGDDGKTTDTNAQSTETGTTDNTTSSSTDATDSTTSSSTDTPATTDGSDATGPTSTSTTEGPTTSTTEPGTTTTEPGTSTTDPGTSTTTEPGTTTGPDTTTGDPLQECLDGVNPGDPCGVCACNECLDELQACQADAGCTAIRDCAQEAGCGGIDCLGPCGDVINQNGGPFGNSGKLAQAIGTCVDSQCANEC